MTGKGVLAPASGQQFEIELGAERAVVCEVGATLRSYVVHDVEVLDGFPAHDRSNSGRGQVLAPWPNRLEDGRYTFVGREGQAAWDEPERRNAIHGLVRWLPWEVVERTDRTVELACLLPPQPAYPWRLGLRLHYELTPAGLEVTATASNESDEPAPFGIGFHPYLTLSGTIDDLVLLVPARRTLLSDARALPIGDESVAGTDHDFTAARALGALQLDTAFTDLVPDVDGIDTSAPRDGAALTVGNGLDGRHVHPCHGVHRRHARTGGAPSAGDRDRADDLPAERVPLRRGRDPPRAR